MPVPTISTKKTSKNKPPSPIITSTASLQWVKEHDQDYTSPKKGAKGGAKRGATGGASRGGKRAKTATTCTRSVNRKGPAPKPRKGELGVPRKPLPIIRGRAGFHCKICATTYGDADDGYPDEWVFCMACIATLHRDCYKALASCPCGDKINKKYL